MTVQPNTCNAADEAALADLLKHEAAIESVLKSVPAELRELFLGLALQHQRAPRSDIGGRHHHRAEPWPMRCIVCSSDFDACRSDARFCSNACRQRAYRRRGQP